MRRASAAALATLAAGFAAAAPGARAVQRGGHKCVSPGARVLARSTSIRIYETRPPANGAPRAIWACLAGHAGHMTLLAATRLNVHSSLGRFELAGHVAAYLETQFGVDSGTTKLVVVDVGTRRVLQSIAAGSYVDAGLIRSEDVTRFLVTSHGSVGWTVTRTDRGQAPVVSVYAAPPGGRPVLLDSGPAVDAGSLALSGTTLSWSDGGAGRTAPMP